MKTIADLVGKNIRARRVALGLSQTALAKSAKISNITLNRIENGKQAPQGASLTMIAEVLGCSEADLYGSAIQKETTAPDILEAIERGVARTLSSRVAAPSAEYSAIPQDIIDALLKATPAQLNLVRGALGTFDVTKHVPQPQTAVKTKKRV